MVDEVEVEGEWYFDDCVVVEVVDEVFFDDDVFYFGDGCGDCFFFGFF